MFECAGDAREAEVARLEGEIAQVCGVLNAATGRLIELIAAALASQAWTGAGIRSAEHWVAWQCGVSPSRARTLVAMARRLPELPETSAALRAGELSEDQVSVVCRHGPAHNDQQLAELARHATVTQLRRTLASYPLTTAATAATDEPSGDSPEEVRRVSFGFTDTGEWRLSALLPVDEGALVERALGNARDALSRGAGDDDADISWADALAAVADASLAADAHRRRHGDRHLVLVHLDAGRTDSRAGDPGAWMHLGPALPEPLRRYINCDTRVRPVWEVDGKPVNVGRMHRTVPDRTRTVIEDRDRGCRVPGCPHTRWLHIHHIVHWEDGGTSDTANLIALCARHHRLHHQGRLGIAGNADDPGAVEFTDHRGRALAPNGYARPPNDPPPEAARDLGITPGRWAHPPGERLNTRWIDFADPSPSSPN